MEELSAFSSCDVSDALGKLGMEYTGHIQDIKLYTSPTKIIGPAYTVEFVLSSNTTAPKPTKHQVDSAPPGSILVIKSPPNAPNAVWGGLMTARAQILGVKGAIIEGRFRDLQEIIEMKFPVWAKGQSTMGAAPFSRVASVGEPICLAEESICPVLVKTGDIVIADEDGVVRIPTDLVNKVVELCKLRTAMDAKCMEDVKNGISLVEAFARHRN
jgi:regulator of RNase E activity RraA